MDRSIQTAFLILFTFSSIAQVDMVITQQLPGAETATLKLEDIIVVQDDAGYDVTFKNINAQAMTFQKSKISVVAYGTEFVRKSNVKIYIVNPDVKSGGRYKVDKFQINYENPYLLNQFIVLEKENMPMSDGYRLVKNWVNVFYNTPREVIKGDIENEYVRVEGVVTNLCQMDGKFIMLSNICTDMTYSLSFAFKDNKIKMQLTRLRTRANSTYVYGNDNSITDYNWYDAQPYFGATINPKTGETDERISTQQNLIIEELNILGYSVKDYLENPIAADDW